MFNKSSEKNARFSRLPQTEDFENLLPSQEPQGQAPPRWRLPQFILSVLLFIFTICTSTLSFRIGRNWDPNSHPSTWAKEITNYSPILEDLPLSYTSTQFNGSLLKENIFRQSASPEVDAAWASLGVNYRALIVPSTFAQKSGLAPDQVKINPKYGGGFPANVEGLHHLHCLNLLRQSLWYNYDYYHDLGEGAFRNEGYIVKFHVSHCLDIVRQQLMCTIDVGLLGQVWTHPEAPEAYVDFNTRHMCRDFEAVRRWAEVRQMPETVPGDWLEPPGEVDRIYEELP